MKVSVIIPLYNKAKYIWDCIETVQNQTYNGEIELCIHDDCSSDESFDVATKCATEVFTKGSISIVKGKANGGTAHATNEAVSRATGDIHFLLGADDLCHPERIERQVKLIEETGALIVDSYLAYEGGRTNFLAKPHLPDAKRAAAVSGKNPMNGGTMAWKKELVELTIQRDGYFFNEGLRHAEDVEFAIRAVKYTNAFCCPHILYFARRNEDNKTAWSERGEQMPTQRKHDMAVIEGIRKSLYGDVVKRKGMFL